MSEIPEDVMKTAEEIFDDVRRYASPYYIQYDELSDETGINWDTRDAVEAIARAIMAEREANAYIAEKHGAAAVAKEIRRGKA